MFSGGAKRWSIALMMLALSAGDAWADDSPAAARQVRFRENIYPLLASRCFECHAGRDSASGYRLDHRGELLGQTGGTPLVRIGYSRQSELIARVTAEDPDLRMPPEGEPLTAAEVNLLRAWIDQGLDWDDSLAPSAAEAARHWAPAPIARPQAPSGARFWA